ncbi:MAG: thermostable hemolysin [Burkholderiales bacterium]|nr:thermostable hemolysin [Burkholderiales bacterium]
MTRVAPASTLRTHGPGAPDRAEIEAFIRDVYRERYGADVHQFAPMLVSLADESGEVIAAAGYRSGAQGALFLERYLSAPIETYLAEAPSALPQRSRLVEVGHLAATRAGAGRRLILLLGPHLAALGFQWVIGTLTQELRQLFVRLGIVPLSLAEADPAVLGAEISRWGSYYDHRPVVLAGRIDVALQAFSRRRALT